MVGSLVTLTVLFGSFAVQESFLMVEACPWRGKCYDLGFTVEDTKCNNYTCKEFEGDDDLKYYKMAATKMACTRRDQCYDLGFAVEDTNCNNYTCTEFEGDDAKIYKMAATKMVCPWRGQCYDLGFTVEDTQCNHYTCTEFEGDDLKYYNMAATKIGCSDYYGNCHDLGSSGLTRLFKGQLRTDCNCQAINNGSVVYQCGESYAK